MASSSGVGKWIAGILATVISSVLIYYLTEGHKPPPVAPLEIEGRVVDVSTNSLISGALVRLKTEKFAGEQPTDSEGRYCFVVESLAPTTVATFEIEASGYPRYSINETLQYLSNLEDNKLMHTAANPPPPVPGSAPPAGGAGSAVGGIADGGKGAAIGATIGAVVAKNPKSVLSPSPVMSAPATRPAAVAIQLPRYVRRVDVVHLGAVANKP